MGLTCPSQAACGLPALALFELAICLLKGTNLCLLLASKQLRTGGKTWEGWMHRTIESVGLVVETISGWGRVRKT